MGGMGMFALILFPLNGLFVVYLWSLTACNLIHGYILRKENSFLLGLGALSLVNMFFIPTVLTYRFFESVDTNTPFWLLNIAVAIIVSVMAKKWGVSAKKAIILYPLCAVLASAVASANGETSVGMLYLCVALIAFPIFYYFNIRNGAKTYSDGKEVYEAIANDEPANPAEEPVISTEQDSLASAQAELLRVQAQAKAAQENLDRLRAEQARIETQSEQGTWQRRTGEWTRNRNEDSNNSE